jgi:hypothetical protein
MERCGISLQCLQCLDQQHTTVLAIVDDQAIPIRRETFGLGNTRGSNKTSTQRLGIVILGIGNTSNLAFGNHQRMHRSRGVDVTVIQASISKRCCWLRRRAMGWEGGGWHVLDGDAEVVLVDPRRRDLFAEDLAKDRVLVGGRLRLALFYVCAPPPTACQCCCCIGDVRYQRRQSGIRDMVVLMAKEGQ